MNKIKEVYKKYPFGSAITSISFLLVLYFVVVRDLYPSMLDRSYFGDLFGGINTFFSGLAFAGVIYTIFLQKEELRLQRKELELTRNELKRSAEAQEKSELALMRQAESQKITAKLNGINTILSLREKIDAMGMKPSRDVYHTLWGVFDEVVTADEIVKYVSDVKNIINSK